MSLTLTEVPLETPFDGCIEGAADIAGDSSAKRSIDCFGGDFGTAAVTVAGATTAAAGVKTSFRVRKMTSAHFQLALATRLPKNRLTDRLFIPEL